MYVRIPQYFNTSIPDSVNTSVLSVPCMTVYLNTSTPQYLTVSIPQYCQYLVTSIVSILSTPLGSIPSIVSINVRVRIPQYSIPVYCQHCDTLYVYTSVPLYCQHFNTLRTSILQYLNASTPLPESVNPRFFSSVNTSIPLMTVLSTPLLSILDSSIVSIQGMPFSIDQRVCDRTPSIE